MSRVPRLTRIMKTGWKWAIPLAVLAFVFYAGILMGRPESTSVAPTTEMAADDEHAEHPPSDTIWTCTMHLQIQRSEPGQCPICGMDLIPLTQESDDTHPRRLVMSPAAVKLAEIATSPVERRFADAKIRMVGKIDYDETRVRSISSYVPGRIDRLYVNYTGIEVKKGDHLAEIYSPELLSAQEELIEAKRRTASPSGEQSEFLRESDRRSLESSREKLRLYGFNEEQIAAIEARGRTEEHMLINSPLGGIVVHKALSEGDYVQTGTNIYTVADLSRVWVQLEAYETDLAWIHFGQHVDIQAEAYPGEHFDGIIAFIDPILDPDTRTVNIRVNVENPDRRLKPGIFVHGTVHSRVAKGGKVMDPDLAGKWISPMHPEIVRDEPGDCPICGMDLLRAEDLGYVSATDEAARPLVIPATAVLKTGRRAIVYVHLPDAERPTYEGREVVLGSRAGDYYIVERGLEEGERVVTNGNFNIDSALQIQARPSMLSMEGESPEEGGDIATLRQSLVPVYDAYLNTHTHLSRDELAPAKEAFTHIEHLVVGVDMTLLEGETHDFWMRASRQLESAGKEFAQAQDIAEARLAFRLASRAVVDLLERFGLAGEAVYYEFHCPMAFDTGASWVQRSAEIANPYYGAEMLTCGDLVTEHASRTASTPAAAAGHQH